MNPGFSSRIFKCLTQDGRNVKLVDDVDYLSLLNGALKGRRFRLKRGTSSDGASTPAIIHSIYPPTGEYWPAAFFHDAVYHGVLHEVLPDLTDVPKKLSKEDGDHLLREAILACGCSEETAEAFYVGVRDCGASSYKP